MLKTVYILIKNIKQKNSNGLKLLDYTSQTSKGLSQIWSPDQI